MAFEDNPQKSLIPIGKKIIYSIVGGSLITLATSFILNTALLGASTYGYPFAWLSQLLYPVGSPITFLWVGLIEDLLVWTIVSFVIIMIYQVLKSR